jgi:hypothetical protein
MTVATVSAREVCDGEELGVLLAALFLNECSHSNRTTFRADEKQHYNAKQIASGKYLVESLAMCGTGHTPVNGKGQLDRTKWLQGSALNCAPLKPVPKWKGVAPPFTLLPPQKDWTGPLVARLLETGISHMANLPNRPCRNSECLREMPRRLCLPDVIGACELGPAGERLAQTYS